MVNYNTSLHNRPSLDQTYSTAAASKAVSDALRSEDKPAAAEKQAGPVDLAQARAGVDGTDKLSESSAKGGCPSCGGNCSCGGAGCSGCGCTGCGNKESVASNNDWSGASASEANS
jgi:membrane protein involved in colicin uptake